MLYPWWKIIRAVVGLPLMAVPTAVGFVFECARTGFIAGRLFADKD